MLFFARKKDAPKSSQAEGTCTIWGGSKENYAQVASFLKKIIICVLQSLYFCPFPIFMWFCFLPILCLILFPAFPIFFLPFAFFFLLPFSVFLSFLYFNPASHLLRCLVAPPPLLVTLPAASHLPRPFCRRAPRALKVCLPPVASSPPLGTPGRTSCPRKTPHT